MPGADDSGHCRRPDSRVADDGGLAGRVVGGGGADSRVADDGGLGARAADGDGYRGPAELRIGQDTFRVHAELRGYFEPIDGRYHWYGRLARHEGLSAVMTGGHAHAVLSTDEGAAQCDVASPDPWWRYRVAGVGPPPFRSELSSPPPPPSGDRFPA